MYFFTGNRLALPPIPFQESGEDFYLNENTESVSANVASLIEIVDGVLSPPNEETSEKDFPFLTKNKRDSLEALLKDLNLFSETLRVYQKSQSGQVREEDKIRKARQNCEDLAHKIIETMRKLTNEFSVITPLGLVSNTAGSYSSLFSNREKKIYDHLMAIVTTFPRNNVELEETNIERVETDGENNICKIFPMDTYSLTRIPAELALPLSNGYVRDIRNLVTEINAKREFEDSYSQPYSRLDKERIIAKAREHGLELYLELYDYLQRGFQIFRANNIFNLQGAENLHDEHRVQLVPAGNAVAGQGIQNIILFLRQFFIIGGVMPLNAAARFNDFPQQLRLNDFPQQLMVFRQEARININIDELLNAINNARAEPRQWFNNLMQNLFNMRWIAMIHLRTLVFGLSLRPELISFYPLQILAHVVDVLSFIIILITAINHLQQAANAFMQTVNNFRNRFFGNPAGQERQMLNDMLGAAQLNILEILDQQPEERDRQRVDNILRMLRDDPAPEENAAVAPEENAAPQPDVPRPGF